MPRMDRFRSNKRLSKKTQRMADKRLEIEKYNAKFKGSVVHYKNMDYDLTLFKEYIDNLKFDAYKYQIFSLRFTQNYLIKFPDFTSDIIYPDADEDISNSPKNFYKRIIDGKHIFLYGKIYHIGQRVKATIITYDKPNDSNKDNIKKLFGLGENQDKGIFRSSIKTLVIEEVIINYETADIMCKRLKELRDVNGKEIILEKVVLSRLEFLTVFNLLKALANNNIKMKVLNIRYISFHNSFLRSYSKDEAKLIGFGNNFNNSNLNSMGNNEFQEELTDSEPEDNPPPVPPRRSGDADPAAPSTTTEPEDNPPPVPPRRSGDADPAAPVAPSAPAGPAAPATT